SANLASEPIFRKLNQAAFATADTPSAQERLHVLASRWWKDELTDYNPAGLTGNRKIGSVRYEFGVHGHAALAASSVIVDDKDVADAIARNVLVWDVRPADAYARGHIAGAINIGDAARVLRDDNTEDLIATDRIEKIMGAAGLDPSRETIVYGSRGAVNIPYEQNWVDPETQTKLARKEVSNNAGMSLKRTADLKQLYLRFDPKGNDRLLSKRSPSLRDGRSSPGIGLHECEDLRFVLAGVWEHSGRARQQRDIF